MTHSQTPELDSKGIHKALTQELGTKFVFSVVFFYCMVLYNDIQYIILAISENAKAYYLLKDEEKLKQSNQDLYFLPRYIWTGHLRISKI